MVIEFIDTDRLFRRAVTRYIDKQLYINKELISYYVEILRWHSGRLFDSDYDEYGISYQVSVYEALAQQLIDISK